MPRTETGSAIDAQIGRNIARRRAAMGLSQSALASSCGISFQQIQKYETGTNRVAASRLYAIARTLEVAPGDLMPSPEWDMTPDPSGAALDECARLLSQVQPALEKALRVARGRVVFA